MLIDKNVVKKNKEDELCETKNWQSNSFLSLSTDTLTRISYIITIYKNLGSLFPTREQANNWVHKPSKDFKGDSAITLISSGHLGKMRRVAEYLNNLTT